MQVTSAVSDAVVVAAALTAAGRLGGAPPPVRRPGRLGLSLMALAATLGCLRFAGWDDVRTVHLIVTGWSQTLGLPALGLAALRAGRAPVAPGPAAATRSPALLVASLLLPVAAGTWAELSPGPAATALLLTGGGVGSALLLAGGWLALPRSRSAGALLVGSVALFTVAGLAVGTRGTFGPVPRLDVFHLTVAAAVLAAGAGTGLVARVGTSRKDGQKGRVPV